MKHEQQIDGAQSVLTLPVMLKRKVSVRVYASVVAVFFLFLIAKYYPYGAVCSGEFFQFGFRAILMVILMPIAFFMGVYALFVGWMFPHRIVGRQGIWRFGPLGTWRAAREADIIDIEQREDGFYVSLVRGRERQFRFKHFLPPEQVAE